MRELEIIYSGEVTPKYKEDLMLLLLDEASIGCASFRHIQQLIETSGMDVVLALPENQYQEGHRGWLKTNILASVAKNIVAVMPVDFEQAKREMESDWKHVNINGNLVWKNSTVLEAKSNHQALKIISTSDDFDGEMIAKAADEVALSNCWLDPAGCVFVRHHRILLAASSSQNLNNSNCTDIPFSFHKSLLNAGERPYFCDSQHAESAGIAKAARQGISLRDSTLYITKFPCRACAKSVISAGVRTIVFAEGSYGLLETADLFGNSQITLKRFV